MEKFNLYTEALIFISIFTVIILVPCYLVFLIGRQMMDETGQYPTRAPIIQAKAILKLLVVEAGAFFCLTAFFRVFTN